MAAALVCLLSIAAGLLSPAVASRRFMPMPRLARTAIQASAVAIPIAYQTMMVVEQVKRKVYPYSIVPGGALNLREAKQAMTDPPIRANYADFNLGQLRQEKLTSDLKGYVSYRWGDQIYWTAKKITLHAGETVYTDGTHIARGRCLNCYSALPMTPIRPHEPSEKALDVAIEMPTTVYSFPQVPLFAPVLPVPPGELTPTVPVLPVAGGGGPGGGAPPGGIWFPLIPIIPPIHRHPTSPGSPLVPPGGPGSPPGGPGSPPGGPGTPPGGPGSPPVAAVPEPSYIVLLGAGFLALALGHRLRRGAHKRSS